MSARTRRYVVSPTGVPAAAAGAGAFCLATNRLSPAILAVALRGRRSIELGSILSSLISLYCYCPTIVIVSYENNTNNRRFRRRCPRTSQNGGVHAQVHPSLVARRR